MLITVVTCQSFYEPSICADNVFYGETLEENKELALAWVDCWREQYFQNYHEVVDCRIETFKLLEGGYTESVCIMYCENVQKINTLLECKENLEELECVKRERLVS